MIFQSLGSNHTFTQAWRHLFATGKPSDSVMLAEEIVKRYGGQATLYAKGRYALSKAVEIALKQSESKKIAINGMTCSVVVDALISAGAEPVYVDVDKTSCNYSPEALKDSLSKHKSLAGIIIQNTFGNMVDISKFEIIASDNNLFLIEDLAHCIGLKYPDGRLSGTVGDMAMLSFGRDKMIDVGSGGALIIHNQKLQSWSNKPQDLDSSINQFRDRIYPLLTWKVRSFYKVVLGKLLMAFIYRSRLAVNSAEPTIDTNKTMPNWQAKLALKRLLKLDEIIQHRTKIMKIYAKCLGDNLITADGTIRAALYVRNRSKLLSELKSLGAELYDTWYDTPIGPARKYLKLDYPKNDNSNSVQSADRIINLPTHQYIKPEDAIRLAQIVRKYV